MFDIAKANEMHAKSDALTLVEWSLSQAQKPIVTTNFGPHEGVILHLISKIKPEIPVVWIDSGYNTRNTYKVAESLIEQLSLNIHVYTPRMSAARQDALGGIPQVDEEGHDEFTEKFKLEPFSRAMSDQAPDVWFTAVRREQTEFRQNMDVFSDGPNGVIKVAPLLDWTEADMAAYLEKHGLPNVEKYFDPTKALANRECGLHTKL